MAPTSRFSRLSLLLLFSASQIIPQVTAGYRQCYYPDGTIPTDIIYFACSDGPGHSGCCDSDGSGDICQDNGLCFYGNSNGNNTYRGTCTDRTWKDPGCPSICLDGHADEWVWTTPCTSKSDGSDLTYACGIRDEDTNVRKSVNCTAGATQYSEMFRTERTTSSKATRYTEPPAVDTAKFTVYVETYTTAATAGIYYSTMTTTWESTFTSALSQEEETGGTQSATRTGSDVTSAPTTSNSAPPAAGSSGPSPVVLGGAIGGSVVVLAAIAGLFFFLRKKRSLKRESGERIHSPPPPNGPVGADQVTPYEAPANEASHGAFAPDKKYVYTQPGNPHPAPNTYEMSSAVPAQGPNGWNAQHGVVGAYEMSSAGEKRYVAEVSGENTPYQNYQYPQYHQQQLQQQNWPSQGGIVSPLSPAPAYGNGQQLAPGYAGAVEMDGSDYAPSRPTTANTNVNSRGRMGVGNA